MHAVNIGIKQCLGWRTPSPVCVKNESIDTSITHPHSEANLQWEQQGERVLKHSFTNNKYLQYLHARRTLPALTMPGLRTSKRKVLEKLNKRMEVSVGLEAWQVAC